MKHFLFLFLTFCLCTISAFAADGEVLTAGSVKLIPAPVSYVKTNGKIVMTGRMRFVTNVKYKDRKWLRHQVAEAFPALKMDKRANRVLRMNLTRPQNESKQAVHDKSLQAYQLRVTPTEIRLDAPTTMGLFYGLQTLRQLEEQGSVVCCEIKDEPRFVYRGLMLDCSRHYWPKEFIMKQLDAMAYLKMDRLHLHLTDEAGWRIQIKKYPKLTEEAAWRTESNWDQWREQGRLYARKDDNGAYGGYYTQKDLKEIVAYAAARHIMVIPEIEMPGHSAEVLHAYPELLCQHAGKQNTDFCVGNEQTFLFLENVLKEVMKVFPSKYIHIGGDEASRKAWKTCPRCQQRMKEEKLTTVAELQSYLTERIERFLNKHGRILIGWDEILEGKLAPNAVVMSWRGEKGGIEAAKAGHDVIMTPGRYCYLDHYQDFPPSQPKAFGSYMPLEQCYSFDPACRLPDSIANHVLGVQGNLWTEQVETMSHCEYMLYPRLFAIAENGWSNSKTDFADFRRRALHMQDVWVSRGYHPFDLRKEIGERPEKKEPIQHLALGKKVVYNAPYAAKYRSSGDSALVDGIRGGWDFHDGTWQGFIGSGRLDVTIDLGEIKPFTQIKAGFFQSVSAVIYTPAEVIIQVSDDGVNFKQLDDSRYDVDTSVDFTVKNLEWRGDANARFIRYQAKSGAQGGWIFTDEICVQ